MKTRLKATGLLLTAFALAVAFSAPSTATTGGHFTTGTAHTTWRGTVHTMNVFTFFGQEVGCSKAKYEGTTSATTTESVTLVPDYEHCEFGLDGEYEGVVGVTENGCYFVLTIGKKALADNTAHLVCPAGKQMEFHLVNQGMAIPPQTFQGVSFTATSESGVSVLTVAFTATGMTTHCELGIHCAYFGTQWPGGLDGSLTLRGFDTSEKAVGIQATGTEG